MIYLQLAFEFFKIGLFSFGGGYATIPFLYHISQEFGWYSLDELAQMTAVASITPGPVGINVATYAGLKTAGVLGSLSATLFEMLPSFVLVLMYHFSLINNKNIFNSDLLDTCLGGRFPSCKSKQRFNATDFAQSIYCI